VGSFSYSLNDPTYSVSSTTTNNSSADEHSVFGHMASTNSAHASFTSTNTNTSNPAHFGHTTVPSSGSTLNTTSTSPSQPFYATNNNIHNASDYRTQESTPQNTGHTSGIAMQSTLSQDSGNNGTNSNDGTKSSNNGNNGYFVGLPGGSESSHSH